MSFSEFARRAVSIKFDIPRFLRLFFHGENNFPYKEGQKFFSDHTDFIAQMSVLYLILIFGLKRLMKNREPFDLKISLAAWNFSLAVFSAVAAFRLLTEFFSVIIYKGLFNSYCYSYDFLKDASGYWAWMFMVSKLFEFIDTIFIVLRKRPLIFLHWYHHVLTFIYTWVSHISSPGYSRYGASINSAVHALMYSYYFVKALDLNVPIIVSKWLTRIQISQFLISLAMLLHLWYSVVIKKVECEIDMPSFNMALFMDLTYLALFINFFIKSYYKGKKKMV